MAGVIQQAHTALNNTINSRLNIMSGIASALQRASANLAASKLYRGSDLIPKNLGRQQGQGITPTCHVGPALVDASVV